MVTRLLSGIVSFTITPAPITQFFPIFALDNITTLLPIQQLSPIVILEVLYPCSPINPLESNLWL